MAVMAWVIVAVACPYERLWLGFALAGGLVGLVTGSFPALVAPAIGVVRVGLLILWLAATLISIWFTRSAFQSGPQGTPAGAKR
jgi:hypothetical protein